MKPLGRAPRKSIFVDTSAFFALVDRTDRFHDLAVRFVESNQQFLITSNLVAQETVTLIRMRLGHEQAVKAGKRLLEHEMLPLVRVTPADERKAWELLKRYADKRFSFTDCTSFVLMRRLGLQTAFAFDQDFRQFGGWTVYPETQLD